MKIAFVFKACKINEKRRDIYLRLTLWNVISKSLSLKFIKKSFLILNEKPKFKNAIWKSRRPLENRF